MSFTKKATLQYKSANGLTIKEYYRLERRCLRLLNKNYECICKIKKEHFPKIIKYNSKEYELELTHKGINVKRLILRKRKMKISDASEQINCILYNLKKNKIRHLDIHDSGKNVCIDSAGTISLIDFDLAAIDENYLSLILKNRLSKYGYNGRKSSASYDTYLHVAKRKLKNIIKQVTN